MTTRAEQRARSAERILAAARDEFGERGYDTATIRSIAARAGVHPSLVMQHHGSKAALFAAAVALSVRDDAGDPGHVAGVLAERLGDLPPEVRAVLRSILTSAEAAGIMRDYLQDRIDRQTRAAQERDRDADAEAEATVAVSAILGLTLARQFLALPSFERVGVGRIAAAAERMLGRSNG
ncbi:TetR/AcrR family transcriptional regulator [Schumannella soli]|uniref:Helix-turn-helix transcriptional regulator n=1 Tax=Schumannella soli TaxID=2590779 RepID=A0A506YBX6_9MICO|nr:TetR/AcrR family transcriptional regulator [Schumannella soli]TPW77929.1 helix-turn-helix transcriptional regulator [Schumannella soli]